MHGIVARGRPLPRGGRGRLDRGRGGRRRSACAGCDVDRFVASPLNVGTGTVTMSHGTFPVPPPATARLVDGRARLRRGRRRAADARRARSSSPRYASAYGPLPLLRPEAHRPRRGHARHPRPAQRPAPDRGRRSDAARPRGDRVLVLETEMDDMSPQLLGAARWTGCSAAGALDVYYTPIQMKKGRPGVLLTVLAPPGAPRGPRGAAASRRPRPSACAGRSGSAPCSSARASPSQTAVRRGAGEGRPARRAGSTTRSPSSTTAERAAAAQRRARQGSVGRGARRLPAAGSLMTEPTRPSTSRRRSTTSTTCRTWGTPTPRSRPTR